MKKMFLYVMLSCIIVIIFVTVYYFIYEQEQYLSLSNNPYPDETMPAKDWAAPRLKRWATEGRPSNSNPKNIIKVKFGNQFILYWNTNRMTSNYGIIRDENYSAILNNNNSIRSMAYFITNEEIVCDICNKENVLKKGDIAYMLLNESRWVSTFECLGIQFDRFEENCSHPTGLLDYIENNRNLVFQKTMFCLDKKGIPRLEENMPDPEGIIKIEFGDKLILYWDYIHNRIIRDENYSAILNNNNSIRSMAYFITNEEIVCNYLCSKESALKKGDIAFKFLSDIEMIGVYSCLGIQFDTAIIPCGLPIGLFNYIENNRNLVFQKVMSCLDKKDAAPSAVRSDK